MKKTLNIFLTIVILVICLYTGKMQVFAYSVSRDDGTWLFPLPASYYNNFSDWAGCPGNDKCVFCGVYHSGWGDSAHSGQGGHNGIDVAAAAGTAVYASASGTANYFYNSARGNTIVIEHKIGNGYSYYTYYQHLKSISITAGQTVSVGQTIGTVGNTGNSGGNHLHFGMLISTSGQTMNSTFLNKVEGYGWVTTAGGKNGRILNNPASTNEAGFPKGKSAVVAPLAAHYGSVHYTFNKDMVSLNNSKITYSEIAEENYYIKNKYDGGYLNIAYGKDANGTAIHTYDFGNYDSQVYNIEKATDGYTIMPLCSQTRILNTYDTTVVSGLAVNLYDKTGHDSQLWKFEAVENGYVIRNKQNPMVCLTPYNYAMIVSNYTGADNQIWYLEKACNIKYDANGGSNAPTSDRVRAGYNFEVSSQLPIKKCNTFLGWSMNKNSTTVDIKAGNTIVVRDNVNLYAVWKTNHTLKGWTQIETPTCTTKGQQINQCSNCSYKETEDIQAIGHKFGDWKIVKEPTVKTIGEAERKCKNVGCSEIETKTIAKLAEDGHTHKFGGWKVEEKATCTKNGKNVRKCTICSETESVVVLSSGHNFNEWQIEKQVTCEEDGSMIRTCKNCDINEKDIVLHTGHMFDEITIIEEATLEKDGLRSLKCIVCGKTKEENYSITSLDKDKNFENSSLIKEDNKLTWIYITVFSVLLIGVMALMIIRIKRKTIK